MFDASYFASWQYTFVLFIRWWMFHDCVLDCVCSWCLYVNVTNMCVQLLKCLCIHLIPWMESDVGCYWLTYGILAFKVSQVFLLYRIITLLIKRWLKVFLCGCT
jgi:hypothetical protein